MLARICICTKKCPRINLRVVLGGIRILGDGIDLRLISRYHGISRYSVSFYVRTYYARVTILCVYVAGIYLSPISNSASRCSCVIEELSTMQC